MAAPQALAGLVVRRFPGSPPNMTQLSLLVSPGRRTLFLMRRESLYANWKAGPCLRRTVCVNAGAGGIELCKHADKKQCVPPLPPPTPSPDRARVLFANVLPVVTDTYFSRTQNAVDIWFRALHYAALLHIL